MPPKTGYHQYEIEPSFVGRVVRQGAPVFDQYLQQTGVGGSALDVNKLIQQGLLIQQVEVYFKEITLLLGPQLLI